MLESRLELQPSLTYEMKFLTYEMKLEMSCATIPQCCEKSWAAGEIRSRYLIVDTY